MGRSPCCQKEGLKKGPWTPEEDQKLVAYVKEHGHGNWRALPKKCGLLRCGKSCRLRWTNYLRPDIKRGLFSPCEEQKIVQLHALVGNKWAFIASQLSKRTDNEIKNYWNTVLKKRTVKPGLSWMTLDHQKDIATSTKFSKSSSNKLNSMSSSRTHGNTCTSHLAQWESARLEAEARLIKEAKLSKTSKPPFTYMGFLSPSTFNYLPSKPILDEVSNMYPFSRSTLMTHSSSSSKSITSLSSQDSITSALRIAPNGRLSWKAQELSFANSPPSFTSQFLSSHYPSKLEDDMHAHVVAQEEGCSKGECSINKVLDLRSMFGLPSSTESLHDILFEVENSCSDVVSTWHSENDDSQGHESDSTCLLISSKSKPYKGSKLQDNIKHGTCHPSHVDGLNMDFESLNFDNLLGDQSVATHNNFLKEILCDTPSQHLTSSTSNLSVY